MSSISSVSGTSTTSASTTSTETTKAQASLDENYNTFLNLLCTQMKNQDPTNPMDTNEMTSQLVQFSSVEQQIGTNKRLETLIAAQKSNVSAGNLMYIGRSVEYEGSNFEYTSDMTAIELGYKFDKSVSAARVDVLDSSGNTIDTQNVSMDTDGTIAADTKKSFVWDFKDSSGNAVSTGTYKIKVTPTAATKGDTVTSTTYVRGLVTNVDSSDADNPVVHVNNTTIDVSKIVSVG